MKRVLIALLLLALLPCAAFADNPPEINNAQLQEMIAKNSGKVIMINFFATWCPPCRAEIPELAKLRASLPESRLLLIGLSVDQNPIVVEPFMKQTGINYPVFMAGQSITDAYGVSSVPHNAFIAPDGKLVISEPGMANEEVLKKVVSDLLK
ncbi:MAG: TlpA family protein disulfide reductase [Desulfovibrio sp.]|nr:TlpA family protein disulfide reductase [Desulfovibrio sp.]